MDYEVQRCTKHCAVSGRELAPGDWFFSVLVAEGAELKRYDYSVDAWQELSQGATPQGAPSQGATPQGTIAWWKSRIPDRNTNRMHWAPNDVMLEFFDELADQPEMQDMRYVLSLLMVRRRVMRAEEGEIDEQGREIMVLYCPRRDTTYRVPAAVPQQSRIDEIQEELAKLLE